MSSIPPEFPASPVGDASRASGRRQSDELLPPVEPPNAGFLLQLFVVPAVIVAGVVLLWFVIESLARSGEQNPAAIVRGLRGPHGFQQANDLADMLQVPERYANLRSSPELAAGVAEYLDELVTTASDDENAVTMRYILTALLGEMRVDEGLPALVRAARDDPERDVRRRAINAIAVLAGALAELNPPQYLGDDELVDALVELSNDKDELIRSETAFAIGVVAAAPDADARLTEALRVLADDPYTDARFNAAVGLARIGSPLAPQAVAEMFDLEAVAASLSGEKPIMARQSEEALRSRRAYKRNTILTSALAAVDMLLDAHLPAATMRPVADALTGFLAEAPDVENQAPIPGELMRAAERTLDRIKSAASD